MKIFPKALLDEKSGAINMCPDFIESGNYHDKHRYNSCSQCVADYWFSEIETPDEPIQDAQQEAKLDNGKMRISIVPLQILSDIAEVREYGIAKYKDPNNWRRVDIERYANALFRHFAAFLHAPNSVDAESGLAHYKHMACNMAFICALMAEKDSADNADRCAACGEVIPEGLQICPACGRK